MCVHTEENGMNAKDVRDGSPKNKRKEIAFYFFYVCSAMLHMSDDSTWSDGQSGILSLVLVNKYKPEREREHGQKKDTGNLHNTHVFTNVTSSKHISTYDYYRHSASRRIVVTTCVIFSFRPAN